jgi:uncharacterized protein (DUF433 family)
VILHRRNPGTTAPRTADGHPFKDEIVSDFLDLTREDIRAVLAFAAARERGLAN